MRSEEDANRAVDLYGDTVRRICMIHLKNMTDTEDIFQTVFLKYVLHTAPFDSPEHEKAWLIRVAINKSINAAKRGARRRTVGIDNLPLSRRGEETQLDEELARLSADDRQVIYLHYYEGYSAKEIAQFMQINENAVHKRLSRARAKLKKFLEED